MAMRLMTMRDVETTMLLFAPVERVLWGGGVMKTVGTVELLVEGDGGGGSVMVTAGVTVLLRGNDPGGDEENVAAIGGCKVDAGESIVAASTVEAMAAVDSVGEGDVVWSVAAPAVAVEVAIERDGKGGIEKPDPELEMKVAAASEEEGYDEDVAPDVASVEIEVIGLDIIIGVGGPKRTWSVTIEGSSSCRDARDNSEGSGPGDTIIDCEGLCSWLLGNASIRREG